MYVLPQSPATAMKNTLRSNFLAILLLLFGANAAYALKWVYIGTSGDRVFDYYVDVDREEVSGPLWTAPIRVESNQGTFLGEVTVNCRNRTYYMSLGNQTFGWDPIEPTSPMDTVVKQVCY